MTPRRIPAAIRIKRDVRRTNPTSKMGMAFPYKKESPGKRVSPFTKFCRPSLFPTLFILGKIPPEWFNYQSNQKLTITVRSSSIRHLVQQLFVGKCQKGFHPSTQGKESCDNSGPLMFP
jgi:hypothetical protein